MDVAVIILMLEALQQEFPNRYQRYRDNFAMLRYVPEFEFKNFNNYTRHRHRALIGEKDSDDASYP